MIVTSLAAAVDGYSTSLSIYLLFSRSYANTADVGSYSY
jgi:hypothetical protein